MGVFLYFLENTTPDKITADTLRAAGLGAAFSDTLDRLDQIPKIHADNYGPAPDGETGGPGCTIFQPPKATIGWQPPTHIGDPRKSTWTKCNDFWLGIREDDPPQPEHVERERIVDGESVRLGDGYDWILPLVRFPNGDCALPQSWGMSTAGEFDRSIRPADRELWNTASRVWDAVNDRVEIEDAEAFAICALLLSTNYRIGPAEITALRLLDDAVWPDVMLAAVAGNQIRELLEEAEKKTADFPAPDSQESDIGEPVDCPDTDQVSPNSLSQQPLTSN